MARRVARVRLFAETISISSVLVPFGSDANTSVGSYRLTDVDGRRKLAPSQARVLRGLLRRRALRQPGPGLPDADRSHGGGSCGGRPGGGGGFVVRTVWSRVRPARTVV